MKRPSKLGPSEMFHQMELPLSGKELEAKYNEARDEYGRLPHYHRDRVLNLVSSKTNAQMGDEAKKAFIEAIAEVKEFFSMGGNFPC